MPAPVLSITETQLFTLLGNFFQPLIDAEIIRGQGNRVPTPSAPNYVVITPVGRVQLGVPSNQYDPIAQTVAISQPLQWSVQVDAFGPLSMDNATALSMVLRTHYACDLLPGIAPLYSGDAVQFPLIDGELQQEERWRFDAVIQYTPVLTLPQQSALALELNLVSVDATYPPE
jgi:hypothetical protein